MKQIFKRLTFIICLPASANLILLYIFLSSYGHHRAIIPLALGLFFFLVLFHILPYPPKNDASIRLTIMMGGRTLCYGALYSFFMQLVIFIFIYPFFIIKQQNHTALWINTGASLLLCFLTLWNGLLRVFICTKRLGIKMRLLMILCMWVPLLNLFVLLYALRRVHEEYDFGCNQIAIRQTRVTSDLCKTKYPLLMVHGVGFRDLHYFNYWGRIPKELSRYGASIYYGNQEAFGTITYNAQDIKKKIIQIIDETGCSKVNIIAHSKGGLDARYAISQLNIDHLVATLTTFNTPHYGCRFVDYACRLPDGLYRFIAKIFDWMFRHFGDQNPDFYTATHQFSTETSKRFNESVPDSPTVYYQSYTSIMKHCFSDLLLTIPYCLIYPLEGKNDGLVSISSSIWGEFKGVITSRYGRGISHADIIDLQREDYKGFDVVEHFVQIVSQLKEMGY